MDNYTSTENNTILIDTDRILQINWNNVCSGCMQELDEEEALLDACPHCGFSSKQESRINALPDKAILNGKYIIGRLLSMDEEKKIYLGYDLNLQTLLQIEEYYPTSLVQREENGFHVYLSDEANQDEYDNKKREYVEESKRTLRNCTESGMPVTIKELFEENNTVYKALKPAYEDNPSEPLQSFLKEAPLPHKKKKKAGIFIGFVVALIIIIIAIIIIAINNKPKKEQGESSSSSSNNSVSSETTCYNPAFLTGAYYTNDNIAIFPIGTGIYFSEISEDGSYGTLYPLHTLENNNLVAAIACDEEFIYYTDGIGSGVYQIKINSDTISSNLITTNPAWSMTLFDEYIYYSNIDSIYRIKKDGSNEITISKNASDYYSLTGEYIYYYSVSDKLIYRADLDGSNSKFLLDIGEITGLIVIGDYMYVNQQGKVYEYNILNEALESPEPISSATIYTELFEYEGNLYFIAEYDTKVIKYNPETKNTETIFDEAICYLSAPIGNNIVILTDMGEYFSVNPTNYNATKLDFNYLKIINEQSEGE